MNRSVRFGAMIMALIGLLGHSAAAQNSTKAKKKSSPLASRSSPLASRSSPLASRSSPLAEPLWPVADAPTPLPGAILPAKRIVAFYGNPLSKSMGILGELDSAKMLAKLDSEVAHWEKADPDHPVQPALHLIAVVASREPGPSGKYRTRMDSALIARVYNWAKMKNAILFLDVQVGQGSLKEELPRLLPWLENPDVHLAVDPEFAMKKGQIPGTIYGTFDAADINYASSLLQDLVTRKNLPPKVLVVHRFRRAMLTGYKKIKLDPRVQIVINMDGWGPPSMKRDSYKAYVWKYPVEYTGFKLFYKNDRRLKGSTMMTPADVLALNPKPIYIQYQ